MAKKTARPAAKVKKSPAKPKLPAVAVKPKVASKPSIPLPPPPPPPPAGRDEMIAPRDIARLIRYGEKLGDKKIDVRWLQGAAAITGAITIFDPANPKKAKTFDRPSGAGQFRVMYAVAQQDGKPEKLAALVIHVGRPPIAKWTVAHYAKDKKPKSPDALPRLASESGWIAIAETASAIPSLPASPSGVAPSLAGTALVAPSGTGAFAAYWAVDAADKPICLVVDFDVLSQKDWKSKPS